MTKALRKGGVGAMMDEYERATSELSGLLLQISDDEFNLVRDVQSKDENCRSIQTMMRHVVRADYNYAVDIRNALRAAEKRLEVPLASRLDTPEQLRAMLAYTAATLDGKWELSHDQMMAVRI